MSVDEIRLKALVKLEIKNNVYAKEIWNAAIEKVIATIQADWFIQLPSKELEAIRKLKV